MMSPSFLPFSRPYLDAETVSAVLEVMNSGWLTGGPAIAAFERDLSDYCGGRTVRTMASGTAALEIALRLAGIGCGDKVLTTPLTWAATANVILSVGAEPLFVDVDRATRLINLDAAASCTDATVRALMPVDLAGLPVDRARVYDLARSRGWKVIEDAAQSLGASSNGSPVGSNGDFVAFSFHANKNVTAGEGGALILPFDCDLALCERWRLQGVMREQDGSYDIDVPGLKANLSEIAATIGRVQLGKIKSITTHRRFLAELYFNELPGNIGLELPLADFTQSNWHLFQVLLPHGVARGKFIAAMRTEGIGIGVHYWPLHMTTLYSNYGYAEGDFPIAEDIGRRTVSLPLFNDMQPSDVVRVGVSLRKVLAQTSVA
jgi:dTDP-4-amino-4,6-dideoxygalactose transaminase